MVEGDIIWILKNKKGVRLMPESIGENPEREGLIETPERIARMCEEIYSE